MKNGVTSGEGISLTINQRGAPPKLASGRLNYFKKITRARGLGYLLFKT